MRQVAAPAVRLGRALAIGAAALLFALPVGVALLLALQQGLDPGGWRELLDDPQLPHALRSTLRSALLGSGLAFALALWLVARLHGSALWSRATAALGPMLALPHAAFAIGLAWLVAPAGWIARLLAPLAGWSDPPGWETVHDADAWLLTLVLALKELPFLLWTLMALLGRPEVALRLRQQVAVARTLGYAPRSFWWRVGWPIWLPRMAWPLLAVLAYGLTVVDLALIVGPTSPPTLAVLAWTWLSDANPARQAQGAAAALLLAALLALLVAAALLLRGPAAAAWRRRALRGDRAFAAGSGGSGAAAWLLALLATVYIAVVLALLALSLAGPWTFPERLPASWTAHAWAQVADSAATVGFSALLAAGAALAALLLAVAWLEATPPGWDRRVMPLVLAPVVVPQLLLTAGLYQAALALRLDGDALGLGWVHALMALPYLFVALAPPWRSFDVRYEWTALALGRSRRAFWWRVKWPLLAAPIAAALAIGFAVSIAQYLSTQFIGAGRHPTVTTEAVTLASGGQRHVAAAFALLQALLPLLGFGAAWAVARRSVRP